MKLSKENIVKLFKTVITFSISKGAAFFAPILLLRFVTIEEYGVVEYSYSMGAILAIVISLGLYGAYPYFILKRNDPEKEQIFLMYGIPALLMSSISLVLYYTDSIPLSIHFIILFTLVFALQRLYSSKLKSEDKGFLGVLVDSGYYYLLSVVIVLSFTLHSVNTIKILLHFMGIYVIILSIFMTIDFLKIRTLKYQEIFRKQLPEVLSFSYKLIISGFIVYWLTSSARIYINWFMNYEQVGIYSYYFRMAGIAVVMYMFIYVAFFKTLYTLEPNRMDKYYSCIMILIVIGCGGCYFILPYVSKFLNASIILNNKLLYLLLCFQMPIWVGFSLCESIIGREDIVNKFNIRIGSLVLIFPIILFAFKDRLNLELFCFLNTLLFFFAFSSQLFLLFQKKIILKRTMIINTLLCISSCLTFFIFC